MHSLGSRVVADERECTDLLTEANARLSSDASPNVASQHRAILSLRSEVLAAHARIHRHTALRSTLDPKARGIANEAVELARAANDPTALGHALLAAHDVGWEPGSAHERLPIIASMADAADQAGDADLVAEASLLRAAALIELGDPSGRAELTRYTMLAEALGHARGRWGALTRRATLAGISGRIDDAIGLADAALKLGLQIGVPDAWGCASAALLDEIGRFADAIKRAYTEGVLVVIDDIAARLAPDDLPSPRVKTLSVFALMVGTLQVSRAVADRELADAVLEQAIQNALALLLDAQPPASSGPSSKSPP